MNRGLFVRLRDRCVHFIGFAKYRTSNRCWSHLGSWWGCWLLGPELLKDLDLGFEKTVNWGLISSQLSYVYFVYVGQLLLDAGPVDFVAPEIMDKGAWRGVEKRVCPGDDQEHHYGHDHEGHDGLRDHGHYGHGGHCHNAPKENWD